jgi:eukaryotic-like serine/threonine-protein kinase
VPCHAILSQREIGLAPGEIDLSQQSTHPDETSLRAFAAGALPEEDLNAVAEHVGQCKRCRERVDEFGARDDFVERLQAASASMSETPERAGERRGAARALQRDARRARAWCGEHLPSAVSIPAEIGPYLILREVGRGGMGVVYQGRHGVLGRQVALKMILAGEFASEIQRQRFHREAELAARVQHPQIVQVYEVAVYQGRPYLALEWCDGGSLADRVSCEGWPPRSAAELIATLAVAIDAAHHCGVVHRDLKPSNILLKLTGEGPSEGPLSGCVPKIADFGLALALERKSGLTSTGQTLGTPEYMAPEQASRGPVGGAADIYALGAILYELLTGRPPFRADTALGVIEALKLDDPIAPRRLRPGLPRDLETIVLKALEKEPAKRYASAGMMAEDLRCFLEARPIRARPPSALDRLGKLIRRWPAVAAVSGALLAVLLGAFGAITSLWIEATRALDQAAIAAGLAQQEKDIERRTRYQAGISAAASALELDHPDEARSLLEDLPDEHRNWEWMYLSGQLDNSTLEFRAAEGPIKAFDLAPDGTFFAYAVDGGTDLRLRRIADARDFGRLDGVGSPIRVIGFSPDGARIAAATVDGTIRVWRVDGRVPVATLKGQASEIVSLVFDRSASRLLFRTGDSSAHLWWLADNRLLGLGRVRNVQFSSDGDRVFYSADRHVEIKSTVDSRPGPGAPFDLDRRSLATAVFSPDGSHIATGSHFPENEVAIYPLNGRDKAMNLRGHVNTIASIDFSSDGRRLASGSYDQTAQIWDAENGSRLAVLRGHRTRIVEVDFVSEGRRLLTRSEDGAMRLWETADGALLGSLRGHVGVASIRVTLGGKFVGVVDTQGCVRIWDLDRTIRRGVLHGHESFVYDVAIAADGRCVASSSWDRTVRFWDQRDCRQSATSQRLGGFVVSVTASPVGAYFATVEQAGVLRYWAPPATKALWSATFKTGSVDEVDGRVAFHPHGRVLALAGARDWSALFYDTANGALLGGLPWHDRPATDIAFSPDGKLIASGDTAGTLLLWNFESRSVRAEIQAHDGVVSRIAFHPRGTMLASVSFRGCVRLFDVGSGRLLASLKHPGRIYGIAFNPDGSRLATACQDSTIQLWDTRYFEKVAELRGHQAYVHAVTFSADGTRLVSGSGDHTVRVWDTRHLGAGSSDLSGRSPGSGENIGVRWIRHGDQTSWNDNGRPEN